MQAILTKKYDNIDKIYYTWVSNTRRVFSITQENCVGWEVCEWAQPVFVGKTLKECRVWLGKVD